MLIASVREVDGVISTFTMARASGSLQYYVAVHVFFPIAGAAQFGHGS